MGITDFLFSCVGSIFHSFIHSQSLLSLYSEETDKDPALPELTF